MSITKKEADLIYRHVVTFIQHERNNSPSAFAEKYGYDKVANYYHSLDEYAYSDQLLQQYFQGVIAWLNKAYNCASIIFTESTPNKRKHFNYEKAFIKLGRRDGFVCQRCGASSNDLQIDHIHPVSKGGGNNFENLQLLCQKCNAGKGSKVDVA